MRSKSNFASIFRIETIKNLTSPSEYVEKLVKSNCLTKQASTVLGFQSQKCFCTPLAVVLFPVVAGYLHHITSCFEHFCSSKIYLFLRNSFVLETFFVKLQVATQLCGLSGYQSQLYMLLMVIQFECDAF